jgi:stage V sporulation protein B
MKKLNVFLYNAMLLVAVSLTMRTVGMYFNVWISNKIGAEAMGVYSLIGGVYGFGITLATSGVNLAVTRLVSEALGKGSQGEAVQIMRRCIIYSIFFGLLAFFLIFALSERIAYSWLDDLRTIRPLRLLAVSLPFISIASALNGYFTAMRKVYKNALTVFIEQLVRISCTVLLLTMLLPPGIEYACVALALGSTIAELVSLIILSSLYLLDKGRKKNNSSVSSTGYVRAMLGITLPVAFSSYVRSGLITVEHALIPAGLKKSGATAEMSLAAYGTLHSMVFPVLLYPAVFITSFSGLLVPELAESRARGDTARIRRIVSRVMSFTLLFSIGTSGIMLCFAGELGKALYSSSESAGAYIGFLAPLMPVMYLDSMTDVMLKGLGQQFYNMAVNIIDSLISVILVWLILPVYGIHGYIFIIYAAELLNASLSIGRLLSVSQVKPDFINWLAKPAAAVVGAVSISRLIFKLSGKVLTGWILTYAIVISALIYILLLSGLFAVERSDVRRIRQMLKRGSEN